MQDKSAEKSSWAARLERLRVMMQCTWAELGKEIGLSESMIYQVKSGARQLSTKAEHRLLVAERMRAIQTPTGSLKWDRKTSNLAGNLSEALTLRESDPDAWSDAFDSAVFVAHARLAGLLHETHGLASEAREAAGILDSSNPARAASIRESIDKVETALKQGEIVSGEFFDALAMLVGLIPEWLEAALEKKQRN